MTLAAVPVGEAVSTRGAVPCDVLGIRDPSRNTIERINRVIIPTGGTLETVGELAESAVVRRCLVISRATDAADGVRVLGAGSNGTLPDSAALSAAMSIG